MLSFTGSVHHPIHESTYFLTFLTSTGIQTCRKLGSYILPEISAIIGPTGSYFVVALVSTQFSLTFLK